jgi:hypothetical protein
MEFSIGTVVGEVVNVLWLAFGGTLVVYLSYLAQRAATHFNLQISDAQRAELADHITHAINLAAPIAEKALAGKGQVEIKNRTVTMVADYISHHHDDLAKAVGIDLDFSSGIERIRAQVETAINDLHTPTPEVLGGSNENTVKWAPEVAPDTIAAS